MRALSPIFFEDGFNDWMVLMENLFTCWEYKRAFTMWQSHTASYAKTTQGQDKLALGEIQDGSKIEDQDGNTIMQDDSHVNCLSFFDNHVLKMEQTFHMGYKEGEKVLHISPTNWEAKKVLVDDMGSWNEMWRRRNFFILIPTLPDSTTCFFWFMTIITSYMLGCPTLTRFI